MGLFDFFKKLLDPPQTPAKPVGHPRKEPDNSPPSELYQKGKALSQCLFDFPYIDPSTVPSSVRQDKPLMDIIVAAHITTVGSNGQTQQTTIDAADRIRLQGEFKTRIYALLDKCLAEEPEHGPALLLYPKVAEWNTRAGDRESLIALNERLLPHIERIIKGSRGYALIEKDIERISGNYFEQVERWLADFHYELGQIYLKEDRFQDAVRQIEKAGTLMPPIYAGAVGRAYADIGEYDKALEHLEKALNIPMKKLQKDNLMQYYNNIKAKTREAEEHAKKLLKFTEMLLPIIEQNPGILQKELFTKFDPSEKRNISSIIQILDEEGLIQRTKKGSTYQLTLDKPASDVLPQVLRIHLS